MPPTADELTQQIEKMLQDTAKGFATKAELAIAVSEQIKKIEDARKAEAEQLTVGMKNLQTVTADLAAQVKNLLASGALRGPDGSYKGMWGTRENARSFGLLLLAAVAGSDKARQDFEARGFKYEKAMGESTNVGGGALVPQELAAILLEPPLSGAGVFRRHALVWPGKSDGVGVPKLTTDATVSCPGAGTAPTATSISFGMVFTNVKKWIALMALPRELAEDSILGIAEVVGRSMRRALLKKEDACGFAGDGSATYFNVIGIPTALLAVNATVGNIKSLQVQGTAGAWSAIVIADLLGVYGLVDSDYEDDVCAFCNKNFFLTVMLREALKAGGAYAAEVIYTGYTRNPQFLGRPVEFVASMNKVKPAVDHIPLIVGSLYNGSVMETRREIEIAQSTDAFFTSDQLGVRATERVGITNHGVGDTTDSGPLCALLADIA